MKCTIKCTSGRQEKDQKSERNHKKTINNTKKKKTPTKSNSTLKFSFGLCRHSKLGLNHDESKSETTMYSVCRHGTWGSSKRKWIFFRVRSTPARLATWSRLAARGATLSQTGHAGVSQLTQRKN